MTVYGPVVNQSLIIQFIQIKNVTFHLTIMFTLAFASLAPASVEPLSPQSTYNFERKRLGL